MSNACRSFVLLGFIYLTIGCAPKGKPAPVGGSDVPPSKVNLSRNVSLIRIEQKPLVYSVETVGVLEPEGQTDLKAGVAGLIDEINFREGDDVSPEQREPLVLISQPLYSSAVKVAQFNVQRAISNLKDAEFELDRIKRASSSISEAERTQREIRVEVSKAELSAARAQLELAEYNLKRSQMRPPYAGRINRRLVTKGSHVEENTIIATMADLTQLRLVTYVPESASSTVRRSLARRDVSLRVSQALCGATGWAGLAWVGLKPHDIPWECDPVFSVLPMPQLTFRGRIFYLSTVGDPTTHQFECKAEIANRQPNDDLLPGFTARVRIPLQTKPEALLAPEEAVRTTERGWLVFVPEKRTAKDGQTEWIARPRRVETGYRGEGKVEIRDGVYPGEWIVQKGGDALDEDGLTPIRIPEEQLRLIDK